MESLFELGDRWVAAGLKFGWTREKSIIGDGCYYEYAVLSENFLFCPLEYTLVTIHARHHLICHRVNSVTQARTLTFHSASFELHLGCNVTSIKEDSILHKTRKKC